MKRSFSWAVLAAMLAAAVAAGCGGDKPEIDLWPKIEPYASGYLKVSDIHEIYWEACGDSAGRPVFVLHGGPGAGAMPYYRRFFDPGVFNIVLHDQRGCGRSRPFLETRENTTSDLVEDIERLRNHLGLGKIILFGGSWGSTLAIAYAETYPENTAGMVLRGVFTATREEIERYYCGGASYFFPGVYEGIMSIMPEGAECISPDLLYKGIKDGDEGLRKRYALAWMEYEAGIAHARPDPLDSEKAWSDDRFRRAILGLGLLENYYMANGCFLDEGQLIEDAGRIPEVPMIMINGRYDMICPPLFAHRLQLKVPWSRLVIVEASGHSMSEPGIRTELLKVMKEFE